MFILKKLGFVEKRQTGNYLIMDSLSTKKIIPVPMHTKDTKQGTLKAIIKQAGSDEQTFLQLK